MDSEGDCKCNKDLNKIGKFCFFPNETNMPKETRNLVVYRAIEGKDGETEEKEEH